LQVDPGFRGGHAQEPSHREEGINRRDLNAEARESINERVTRGFRRFFCPSTNTSSVLHAMLCGGVAAHCTAFCRCDQHPMPVLHTI
jgi:hypothetical protein